MGGGASTLPDVVDKEAAKTYLGDEWSQEVEKKFHELASGTGGVTEAAFEAALATGQQSLESSQPPLALGQQSLASSQQSLASSVSAPALRGTIGATAILSDTAVLEIA